MPKERQPWDYEPVRRGGPAALAAAGVEADPAGCEPHAPTHGAGEPAPAGRRSDDQPATARQAGGRRRRGHIFSYVGLILFTVVTYFRPQEFIPSLATVQLALFFAIVTLIVYLPTQLALAGNLTARPREVNLMLLLSLTALLSIPFGISPPDALNSFWEFFKAIIVFILIVNVVHTERRLRGMFFLAMAVSCTLAVGALNDYRLGNLTVEGYRVQGIIKGGMFENPNDLGIHFATMFPLALALGLASRNVFGKLLYGACTVLVLAASVVTFSRGNFLGLVAAGALMAWKFSRRRRAVAIVSAAAVLTMFVVTTPPSYWLRIASIFDSSLDAFGSSSMRGELLVQSFWVTLRHPLIGVGIGNFTLMSARSLVSHNSYTQVGAELGLFALLIYAMLMTAPIRRLRQIERETLKAKREQSRFYFLAVGIQASLVAYMTSSFFASVAFYWFLYYLVGYAVCFRQIYADSAAPPVARPAYDPASPIRMESGPTPQAPLDAGRSGAGAEEKRGQ